jgi:thiamine-phosphate diphosphorylase
VSGLPFDILVITDQAACAQVGKTVVAAVELILLSPLSHRCAILVRDKSAPPPQVAELLQILQPMAQAAGTRLLVHTHVDLALALGLDGVHLASHGNLKAVRSQLPSSMLLGVSRHAQDSLDHADIGLANYATISPIYRPTSKPNDLRESLGVSGLQSCVQRSLRPLVALGGMQPERVGEVMRTGVGAIAISGAILQAKDPAMMLNQFCKEIDRTNLERGLKPK